MRAIKNILLSVPKAIGLSLFVYLVYHLNRVDFGAGAFQNAIRIASLGALLVACSVSFSSFSRFLALIIRVIHDEQGRYVGWWLLAGLTSVIYPIILLQLNQPYYFTQDDTHSYFFPLMLPALRSFFEQGIFPTWNGYQFLGMPSSSYGFTLLTYPFSYFSYAIARYLFGNEYLTIEVMAALHFIAGYFICFWCFRSTKMSAPLAVSASVCFILLGYNLIAGRSWLPMMTLVVWIPALGWSLLWLLHNNVNAKWILVTSASIGLFFHAGHIQNWIYGCFLWGLGVAWIILFKRAFWQNLAAVLTAFLVGFSVLIPLLYVQYQEMHFAYRGALNATIESGLNNMLLPWPFVFSPHEWVSQIHSGTMYFSGGVFIFLFFLHSATRSAYLLKGIPSRYELMSFSIIFLAIVSFLLALGSNFRLWDWLAQYQPFSRFRMPFKWLPFATFYMIAAGALFAEYLCRKSDILRIALSAMSLVAIALAVFNASNSIDSFHRWYDKPYPSISDNYAPLVAKDFSTTRRTNPFSHWRSGQPHYSMALSQNYASVYSVPTQYGYDFLEAAAPEYRNAVAVWLRSADEFYREYAVEWITISKLMGELRPWSDVDIEALRNRSSVVLDLGAVEAFNIATSETKHMAYLQSFPQQSLQYNIRTDGVDIDLSKAGASLPATVVVNFLHRHWFKAYTNVESSLPLMADEYGRIVVALTKPATMLSVRYNPPWHYGFSISAGLLLIAFGLNKMRTRSN